jgi:hypothetical protein
VSKYHLRAVAAMLTFAFPLISHADEQLVPLAINGEWVAVVHKVSITSPPDVCVAFNAAAGVALHADRDTVQFRVTNKKWSLPASVEGSVLIVIGEWNETLAISDNTEDTVSAEVTRAEILTLLTNMDKAATMTVTAGRAKPIPVSLTGS